MRFLSAWEGVSKENTSLRIAIYILGLCLSCESAVLLFNSKKVPLLIERACYTKMTKSQSADFTEDEVKVFLRLAIEKRFNSLASESDQYLSLKQRELRKAEQDELKTRAMRQTVFVNSVKIDTGNAIVDADRLISVGDIRSAFPFKLNIKFEQTDRSESNPYGLVLVEVENSNKENGGVKK